MDKKGTRYDATKWRTQSCPNIAAYPSVSCIGEVHEFPLASTGPSLDMVTVPAVARLQAEHCTLWSAVFGYNKHVTCTKSSQRQGLREVERTGVTGRLVRRRGSRRESKRVGGVLGWPRRWLIRPVGSSAKGLRILPKYVPDSGKLVFNTPFPNFSQAWTGQRSQGN
jgi:hypothetical protein